ncbi:hypothetical protein CLV87_0498 [Pelagimonas phthalicica]|nr:hypothetical protein CLV87_0498 [Pelagimonas phthalicica]
MADPAYSKKEIRRAVNLSAFLGWLAITFPFLWLALGASGFAGMLAYLFYASIFGLPLAFALCWLVGRPILGFAMKAPVSWGKAVLWGAVISTTIAGITIAIGRYRGWRQSLDDRFYSRLGGGDNVQSIDGILTLYGWQVLAQNTALFVALGVAIALIVRWHIGPGHSKLER